MSSYMYFGFKRKNHSYEVTFTEEELKEVFKNEINFIRFCEKFERYTGVPILSKYAKLKFITEYIENINSISTTAVIQERNIMAKALMVVAEEECCDYGCTEALTLQNALQKRWKNEKR